jgi:DNA ligase (NAD+)
MTAKEAQGRVSALRAQIHKHNHAYYVEAKPTITDFEFDALFKELCDLEAAWPAFDDLNSPSKRVGSPVVSDFPKVKHARKMLSLDNTYAPEEVTKFFEDKNLEDFSAVSEPKIDGLSLSLHYKEGKLVQAVTRGDGACGDDVTDNARVVSTVPLVLDKPLTVEVRGEACMMFSVFETLNEELRNTGDDEFANPRNAAAGTMKLKDSRIVAKRKLTFIAYNVADPMKLVKESTQAYQQAFGETQETVLHILGKLGFMTTLNYPMPKADYVLRSNFLFDIRKSKEVINAVTWGMDMRRCAPFPTDGLVFKLNNLFVQAELGDGTRAPKWAAAYKFPPECKSTKLLGVEVSIGRHGTLTPVAILEAVHLSGTTVTRASLCNQDEIERLRVNVGDIVYVEKSAEIIPKLMGLDYAGFVFIGGKLDAEMSGGTPNVNEGTPIQDFANKEFWRMPTKCPCCGHDIVKDEGMVAHYCPNSECKAQVVERLKHATCKSALDWDGMGEETVTDLVEKCEVAHRPFLVRSMADLFRAGELELAQVLKGASLRKFLAERERVKKAPLWRKIHSLGIEGIGKSLSQDLCARWHSLAEMIDHIDEVEIILGEVNGKRFVQFLIDNQEELDLLQSLGFAFEEEASAIGKLSGSTFVITGAMTSGTRDQVERRIEAAGGAVKSSVSKKVTYLVVGEGGGNNKAESAKKHGTKILTEEQLYEMMGQPMPTKPKNELSKED